MYTQKRNNNIIKLDFETSGINYTLKDENINKTEFIPFENITNNSHEIFESNKSYKHYAIYTGVVGTLFLIINIFYSTKLWAWLFLLACPTFFILFKRSKTDYKVLNVESKMDIFVINDKQQSEIIEKVYSSRNIYLKSHYGKINYNNDRNDEVSKFSWLKQLGIINEREFEVIREEIINYE